MFVSLQLITPRASVQRVQE